jgi:methylglyoxal synthase
MKKKRIALIAHDNLKSAMLGWVGKHRKLLMRHQLCATATTGGHLEKELKLRVKKFKSGPLGGDLQIGAKIAEGEIDLLVFLWDPLSPHSHDVDVKALLRIAAVYDIPVACNLATADYIVASRLM